MYRIKWSSKALKQFARVGDTKVQTRIADAVETLGDWPTTRNVIALSRHACGYRLRVGNYRVLFDADTEIQIIDIQEVKKRDEQTY